jgi:hypothetical protein
MQEHGVAGIVGEELRPRTVQVGRGVRRTPCAGRRLRGAGGQAPSGCGLTRTAAAESPVCSTRVRCGEVTYGPHRMRFVQCSPCKTCRPPTSRRPAGSGTPWTPRRAASPPKPTRTHAPRAAKERPPHDRPGGRDRRGRGF